MASLDGAKDDVKGDASAALRTDESHSSRNGGLCLEVTSANARRPVSLTAPNRAALEYDAIGLMRHASVGFGRHAVLPAPPAKTLRMPTKRADDSACMGSETISH